MRDRRFAAVDAQAARRQVLPARRAEQAAQHLGGAFVALAGAIGDGGARPDHAGVGELALEVGRQE